MSAENITKIKTRVINVMKNWIDDYYTTFDEKLKSSIQSFIERLPQENRKLGQLLNVAIMKKVGFTSLTYSYFLQDLHVLPENWANMWQKVVDDEILLPLMFVSKRLG